MTSSGVLMLLPGLLLVSPLVKGAHLRIRTPARIRATTGSPPACGISGARAPPAIRGACGGTRGISGIIPPAALRNEEPRRRQVLGVVHPHGFPPLPATKDVTRRHSDDSSRSEEGRLDMFRMFAPYVCLFRMFRRMFAYLLTRVGRTSPPYARKNGVTFVYPDISPNHSIASF